ncbi:MAG: hypothetical protein ACOY3Y_07025 [Acidobacteriota bacterium]
MGNTIRATAPAADIRDDVQATMRNAERKGGDILAAATARVAPHAERLTTSILSAEASQTALDAAMQAVLRADEPADRLIKRQRDGLWNALDRPRESPVMNDVYPGGVGTYTDCDVRIQPTMMQVLEARIGLISHPAVSAEQRAAWQAEIAAARTTLADTLAPLQAAEAVDVVADKALKAAARAAAVGLARFKRDLKNMGLTETQIHEIIPDRPVSSGRTSGPTGTPPTP